MTARHKLSRGRSWAARFERVELTSLPNTSSVSHRQTMGRTEAVELLPGTLDLLILKALVPGAMHGYGIAQLSLLKT
jgi:hypothetical protein